MTATHCGRTEAARSLPVNLERKDADWHHTNGYRARCSQQQEANLQTYTSICVAILPDYVSDLSLMGMPIADY